jgi:acyl-homoserine-lactone acylase
MDPSSPWYRDQTEMFGQEQWVSFPFTPAQVAAQQISSMHLTGGA